MTGVCERYCFLDLENGGMSRRRRGKIPLRLLRLVQRLAARRAPRTKGERIPLRLWKMAADLAGLGRSFWGSD